MEVLEAMLQIIMLGTQNAYPSETQTKLSEHVCIIKIDADLTRP